MFRIGFGYDVHRLERGYDLWIGGVKIAYEKGAVGHSDADVLLHAICDALLGALALGDIGKHFPDTDPKYKGIDSKLLLKDCVKLMHEKNHSISNMDATVVLEQPKLRPHIDAMRKTIAEICELKIDQVNIKATTSEKLGFVGEGKGIAAYANVLLYSDNN